MKKLNNKVQVGVSVGILIVSLLLISKFVAYGHSNSVEKHLTNKKSCALELVNMNVVYAGLNNPINLAVSGVSDTNIVAEVTKGKSANWRIEKKGIGVYHLKGERKIREIEVSIYETNMGKKVLVDTRIFRVRPVPVPRIKLGAIDGCRPVTAGMIKNQATVYAALGEGFAYNEYMYSVTSYSVVILKNLNGKELQSEPKHFKGNDFQQARYLCDSLKAGDQLLITHVEAQGPKKRMALPGLILEVN